MRSPSVRIVLMGVSKVLTLLWAASTNAGTQEQRRSIRPAILVQMPASGTVGLKPEGVPLASGGRVVTDAHSLHALLADRKIGEIVTVTVWRDGQTLTFSPVLVEAR